MTTAIKKPAVKKGKHVCLKENELGHMTAILEKVSKEVYGNGEIGLSKSVPRMEEKINHLTVSVAAHTSVVAKLLEFQAGHTGEEKNKKDLEAKKLIADELAARDKRDKWTRKVNRVMALIAFVAVAATIYFGFRNINKQVKAEVKTEVKAEVKSEIENIKK